MTPEEAMKRCQTGCTDLQMANNLLAACYGVIGALMGEVGALKVQLNSAKRGMDSAKNAGAKMMVIGKKLAAENSPEAIESEREANAVLTAENERLQAEVKRLRASVQAEKSVKETIVAQRNRAYEVNDVHLKRISLLERERDQLKGILQDVNTSDYRFSVEQLAAHDAEVIERFARELGVFDSEYDDQGYIEVPRYAIKEYANQLRQQAKEVQS